MTKLFYVTDKDRSFGLFYRANTKEEVFEAVVAILAEKDEMLNETITDFSSYNALFHHFLYDEVGAIYDDETGDLREDLCRLSEEEVERYLNQCIEKNSYHFWSDTPQYAEEYLREYKQSCATKEPYSGQFSKDFIIKTVKQLLVTEQYCTLTIEELDFNNQLYVVTYDEHHTFG